MVVDFILSSESQNETFSISAYSQLCYDSKRLLKRKIILGETEKSYIYF